MRSMEMSAKTVEAAVQAACEALGVVPVTGRARSALTR